MTSSVTVVVISRDRRTSLLRTVERLRAVPERPPVIVVDNASSDGSAAAVRRQFPDVHVVTLPRNHGAAARTTGVLLAATPYVAFSDDDSWWAPGAVTEAARVLDAHPRLAVLAGRILVGPAERLDPVCAQMAASPLGREPDLPGPSVLGFVACGAVVRRSAYLQVGGFSPRFGVGGEEQLLAVDLASSGWGLAYVDSVTAHHHPAPARDPAGRRRIQARNALWVDWLRRPVRTILRREVRDAPALLADPSTRGGVLDALRGLPWVMRDRRVVTPEVETRLRSLGG